MLKVTLQCELSRCPTDSPVRDTTVFFFFFKKIGNATQGMLVKREIKDSSGITDVTVGVNMARCCWYQGIKLFPPFI